MSLDNVITRNSVLKMDVEGAELDVIRSGYDSFRKGLVDLVIIEVTEETVLCWRKGTTIYAELRNDVLIR